MDVEAVLGGVHGVKAVVLVSEDPEAVGGEVGGVVAGAEGEGDGAELGAAEVDDVVADLVLGRLTLAVGPHIGGVKFGL